MKIYDISREIFGCTVYPGDTVPEKKEVRRMAKGDRYNLTDFSMCAHNGTHVDAPFHFFEEGKTVDQMVLSKMVGSCFVTTLEGDLTEAHADAILKKAQAADPEAAKRILLRGNAMVTEEGASRLAHAIDLIGVESQSVGDVDAPMKVHTILLRQEVVLLEGLCLQEVPDGMYFLSAAPLNLGGCDDAPCRAILIEF